MSITVRPATPEDQAAIRALVHAERLNPTGLHWPNFVVATQGPAIVGAAQMRRHPDGSRELGSLVVAPHARGQGISTRLIEALLAQESRTVHVITEAKHATRYAAWGFRTIEPADASGSVRWNHRLGRLAGIISFFKRRPLRHLVILRRIAFQTAPLAPQVPITPPSRRRITTVADRGLPVGR
jgi:amino-acid N-acetyltransferase